MAMTGISSWPTTRRSKTGRRSQSIQLQARDSIRFDLPRPARQSKPIRDYRHRLRREFGNWSRSGDDRDIERLLGLRRTGLIRVTVAEGEQSVTGDKIWIALIPTIRRIDPRAIGFLLARQLLDQIVSPVMSPTLRINQPWLADGIQRFGKHVVIVVKPLLTHPGVGFQIVMSADPVQSRFHTNVIFGRFQRTKNSSNRHKSSTHSCASHLPEFSPDLDSPSPTPV